jgi:hypothetical protein
MIRCFHASLRRVDERTETRTPMAPLTRRSQRVQLLDETKSPHKHRVHFPDDGARLTAPTMRH